MSDSLSAHGDAQPQDGSSGIIEHMLERAGLEGDMYNRLYPVMLDVSHVKGTKDAFRISDRGGCIPTGEEFWTFVDYVSRVYWHFSDEEIEEYNQRRQQQDGRSESETANDTPTEKDNSGYVYVISGGGYCKIGKAKDPDTRIKGIGTKLPFPIRRLLVIPANDYTARERELHEHFADKRAEGEWFTLTPADIDYIRGLANE